MGCESNFNVEWQSFVIAMFELRISCVALGRAFMFNLQYSPAHKFGFLWIAQLGRTGDTNSGPFLTVGALYIYTQKLAWAWKRREERIALTGQMNCLMLSFQLIR